MAYLGRRNEEAERGGWKDKGEEGLKSGWYARTRARSMFGDVEGTPIRSACWTAGFGHDGFSLVLHQMVRACMGDAYESVLLFHLDRCDWVVPAVVVD